LAGLFDVLTVQLKSQHILMLIATVLAVPACAAASPSSDLAATEAKLSGSPPLAPAIPRQLMPVPSVGASVKPGATQNGAAKTGAGSSVQSADSTPRKDPDFASLISAISMVGWKPGATMVYKEGSPAAAVSDVSSQIQKLPFDSLNGTDSDRTAILKEFRCSSVVKREYQRGQRRILVEAFSFPNSNGAYGAYYLLRHGASTVIRRGDASSEDDQSISFWKDKFYIHVYGTSEDDEESKEAVRSVADQLAAAIVAEPAVLPPMISRLPALERVRGSEKLVMGPISARRFFPAPYINTLELHNALGAAVADYQFQFPYPERLKLLFVEYEDPKMATQAYADYIANLQTDNREANPAREDAYDMGAGVNTSSLFKVAGSYLLCQVRGQQLILISGARKKTSPTMLARQLY